MAALTYKIGGDTSGLSRAVGSAKGLLTGLAGALKTGALAGGALAIGGLTTAVLGLKKALDLGGRLSDVSANTGLLAGEAMVLERAFADAGIGGEKLQATIQKMQKSIVEAGDGLITPKRALDELGLSVSGLLKMSPADQFAAIQSALAGLSDPAERSARAMQIFGRSGGELGALFSNSSAMENAAESVGSQADILNQSADDFDRSADILGSVGDKIRGFFVGLASFINPVLLPVLEELNKIDLAKIGQSVGKTLMVIVEAFKQDKIGEILKHSFLYAGKELINFVIEGFAMAGVVLLESVKGVGAMIKEIFSLENLKSAGMAVSAKGFSFARSFAESPVGGPLKSAFGIIPDSVLDDIQGSLDKGGEAAGEHLSGFTDRVANRFGEVIKSARGNVREMAEAVSSADVMGANQEKEIIQAIIDSIKKSSDIAGLDSAIKNEIEKKGFEMEEPNIVEGLSVTDKILKPVVTSLGRVGGDGNRGQSVIFRMDKERNKLLKDIAFNTGNGTTAVYG
jgi:hypothetical protein